MALLATYSWWTWIILCSDDFARLGFAIVVWAVIFGGTWALYADGSMSGWWDSRR